MLANENPRPRILSTACCRRRRPRRHAIPFFVGLMTMKSFPNSALERTRRNEVKNQGTKKNMENLDEEEKVKNDRLNPG